MGAAEIHAMVEGTEGSAAKGVEVPGAAARVDATRDLGASRSIRLEPCARMPPEVREGKSNMSSR
jgi:hypothetical protein